MKLSFVLKKFIALEIKAYSFPEIFVGAKKRDKSINIKKNKKFFLFKKFIIFDFMGLKAFIILK
tara:strand:+ start:373 stop:564 length:192 start_codon:yes stop_codon:yes gene_type:complete